MSNSTPIVTGNTTNTSTTASSSTLTDAVAQLGEVSMQGAKLNFFAIIESKKVTAEPDALKNVRG